jgi:CubicO group peptidase (beta-lactamase class C family)
MNKIDTILLNEISKHRTPSAQFLLFNQDRILKNSCYGLASIDPQIEASENSSYHLYSITKTFTALAVLQLAEKGLLHIENPVQQYLTEFPYGPDITIKQVLNHTAGIPNPIPLNWIHLEQEHPLFNEKDFFRNIFEKNKKTTGQPNEKFAYSNLGYILLGMLIEKLSSQLYEDYIRENIIRKIDISESELDFRIHQQQHLATGYHKRMSFSNLILGIFMNKKKYMTRSQRGWKPFHNFYVNGNAYGGLIGTADALAKYGQELLRPNNRLLSEEYRQKLFTENYTNSGKATGMCLSWFKGTINGQTFFTHAGGGGGYYCELRIYPGKNLGAVILFNRTGMRDERFLDKLHPYYFPSE